MNMNGMGPDMGAGFANQSSAGNEQGAQMGFDPAQAQAFAEAMQAQAMAAGMAGQVPPPQMPYGYPPMYHMPYGPAYGQPFYGAAATPPPQMQPQQGFATQNNEMQSAVEQLADQNGLGMLKSFLNFSDGDFWKGALVGAAAVMLLTNEDLRNSLLNGAEQAAESVKSKFTNNEETEAENTTNNSGKTEES